MEQQLAAFRVLGVFASKGTRLQVRNLSAELDRLTSTVDGFYDLLGPRHWVFHGDMSVESMAALIHQHAHDAAAGERALIDWYSEQNRVRDFARRLTGLPDLRAREQLLSFAVTDYEEGRFYAVVQVLLSVMDGFVNDIDKSRRKGLHARTPDELNAWDSVVGHHLGLSAAHRSFARAFKARSEEPVTELYRNGIVHGMLTNYDNDVVATKAWNRLFALGDWARSLQAQQKEAEKAPEPTFRELVAKLSENQATKQALAAFAPSVLRSTQPEFAGHPVNGACAGFLDAWRQRNYGVMAASTTRSWKDVSPLDIRNDYQAHSLAEYQIVVIDHSAAAVCSVTVRLIVDGVEHVTDLRWVREGDDGRSAAPNQPGQWRLMWWGFPHMIKGAD